MDYPEEATHFLYGVVDKKKENAIFAFVQLTPNEHSHPPNLRFRGLMGHRIYHVQIVSPVGDAKMMQAAPPEWISLRSVQVSGSRLEHSGLPAPILCPAEALLLELSVIS